MAIEYLKKFFGEDGQAALTFDELSKAIEADKGIKLYNLADGGYVSKDKLDGKIAELAEARKQLEDANTEIQSYKDMDIDGIKKSVKDWEKKYQADMEALQAKMADREYEYQISELANGVKFSSASARKAIISELMANRLGSKDGAIMGFDDYINKCRESDPGAFASDVPDKPAEPEKKPTFAGQTSKTPKKKLTLTELMIMANEGKDTSPYQ